MAKSEDTSSDAGAQAPSSGSDERFPVERLLEDSAAFGLGDSHVLAGALHGTKKTALSIEEARAARDSWLKQSVSTDTPETA